MTAAPTIRESVDQAPMSPFQIGAVTICLLINLVDGFDVLVMAFAASGVSAEWGLTSAQIGALLSSALVGMALGSAVLAPLADRIGRRPLTLVCLTLCTAGMVLAAISTGPLMLGASRLLTGLGIGGMVATLPVVIMEYAPRRLRGTMVAVYGLGLPVGGMLGGAVAAALVGGYGWRSLFVAGAVISLAMLVVVALAMPESLDYLVERRPPGAVAKVNYVLTRMRLDPVGRLPERQAVTAAAPETGGIGIRRSVLLWLAYFVMMAGFYFASSWTPLLLEQSGHSAEEGLQAGLLLNLGGVVGTLLVAVLALRIGTRTLAALALLASAVAYLVFAAFVGSAGPALVGVIAVGLAITAGGTALNALAPTLYPTSARATGVGWAVAIGRVGALTAPVLAGVLLGAGWAPRSLLGLFALPLLVAAVAVLALRLRPAVAGSIRPAVLEER